MMMVERVFRAGNIKVKRYVDYGGSVVFDFHDMRNAQEGSEQGTFFVQLNKERLAKELAEFLQD